MNNKMIKPLSESGPFSLRARSIAFSFLILSLCVIQSNAAAVDLNYENLSSLQEPIATHIGDTTVLLTGLVDAAVDVNSDDDEKETRINTNFQISAQTQLDNSLTVGAAYFGDYDSSNPNESAQTDRYEDNIAAYVSGVWGTVSAGDVTGMVREDTRRIRGAGNAELNYDDTFGQLDERGVAYIGRYGPLKISSTVDEEGHFDIGATYQRPLGNKDYRFAVRYRNAELISIDSEPINLDSNSLSAIAELTYGSSVYDVGLGIEKLESTVVSVDRTFLSFGFARKIGVVTLSAQTHFADIDGQSERSYAFGASYDIARGLSLNLGINHSESDVNVQGVSLRKDDQTEGSVSVRYGF